MSGAAGEVQALDSDLLADPVAAAQAYIAGGVAVLPLHSIRDGSCTCGSGTCHSPGKHPLTRHGKDDATLDVGVLSEWFGRWPGMNLGGVPPQGVVVLDVDLRNDGDHTLAALEAEHGALPPTLTARTGSGGWHYWFTYNGPSRGRLGDGIDIKSHTGYLVLPPSVHACGGTYRWTNTKPAVPAPRWVRLRLNPPITRKALATQGAGNVSNLVAFVLASPQGERNSRYYWACCRAHENGDDLAPLIAAAESIGLDPHEAMATAQSAEHAPRRKADAS